MAGKRATIGNIVRLWRMLRGHTGDELRRLQAIPVSVANAGSAEARQRVAIAAGEGAPSFVEYDSVAAAGAAGETLILDADSFDASDPKAFAEQLGALARREPDVRIALGARYPVFRGVVSEQLTGSAARLNARLAAMSALPGIVPLTDWLLPVTSAGDMLVLTRNQVNLALEISAAHGLAPDPRERLMEIAPIVGGAFGWRALAREAVGLVPGGVGVAVKAGIAYAGTYAIGRAVSAYYATGRTVDAVSLFRSTVSQIVSRGAGLVGRGSR